jgi:hypothetical protein
MRIARASAMRSARLATRYELTGHQKRQELVSDAGVNDPSRVLARLKMPGGATETRTPDLLSMPREY